MKGKYVEALYREQLSGRRRTAGPDAPETLLCSNRLGISLYGQGKHAEAAAIFRSPARGARLVKSTQILMLQAASNLAAVRDALPKLTPQ